MNNVRTAGRRRSETGTPVMAGQRERGAGGGGAQPSNGQCSRNENNGHPKPLMGSVISTNRLQRLGIGKLESFMLFSSLICSLCGGFPGDWRHLRSPFIPTSIR